MEGHASTAGHLPATEGSGRGCLALRGVTTFLHWTLREPYRRSVPMWTIGAESEKETNAWTGGTGADTAH